MSVKLSITQEYVSELKVKRIIDEPAVIDVNAVTQEKVP